MSDLGFALRRQSTFIQGVWKAVIVDDDKGIHDITRTVLRDLVYENRTIEFISAYSRTEAEHVLQKTPDIALILLDVVMEEDDSGLQLVKFVRNECGNRLVRIILRTGVPGKAPSQEVIVNYDINDYEEKTDLTAQKLYTTVFASLRNYHDLELLDRIRTNLTRHRNGLKYISEASAGLFSAQSPADLVSDVHRRMRRILGGQEREISSFAALQDQNDFRIVETEGRFSGSEGSDPRSILGDSTMELLRALKRENRSMLVQEGSLNLYEDARVFRMLIHVADTGRLEIQDRQLLDILASNISLAFENLKLNREIIGTQEDLIVSLSEVVETRSHDTAQHVRRVGQYCELLASRLGMDEVVRHDLKMASSMHDIGKIGIPDQVLLKPDVLTDEEFSIVKTHTTIGYELLKNSGRPLLRTASMICLQHHERFDGSGYPNGLAGPDIHINARIVSICDVFDALTHDRIQRRPWEIDEAAGYLRREKSGAFDPELVDLFLDDLEAIDRIRTLYPD